MAVNVGNKRRSKSPRVRAEESRVLHVEIVKEAYPPPTVSPGVRIAAERGGVAIWSRALFGDPPTEDLRQFLTRVLSIDEI
jgi:hypothetical protein